MKKILVVFLTLLLITSCSDPVAPVNPLEGKWIVVKNGHESIENIKFNDNTLDFMGLVFFGRPKSDSYEGISGGSKPGIAGVVSLKLSLDSIGYLTGEMAYFVSLNDSIQTAVVHLTGRRK